MKIGPEAVALIIYAIETALRLKKESGMTEEQIKEEARKNVIQFALTMEQINEEIAKYLNRVEKTITTR